MITLERDAAANAYLVTNGVNPFPSQDIAPKLVDSAVEKNAFSYRLRLKILRKDQRACSFRGTTGG